MKSSTKPGSFPPEAAVQEGQPEKRGLEKTIRIENPGDFFRELKQRIHPALGADFRLTLDVGKSLNSIAADPKEVECIFLHLVACARNAMPQGGKILMAAKNVTRIDKEEKDEISVKPAIRRFIQLSMRLMPYGSIRDAEIPANVSLIDAVWKKSGGEVSFEMGGTESTALNFILPSVPETNGLEKVCGDENKGSADSRWWQFSRGVDPLERIPSRLRRWLKREG